MPRRATRWMMMHSSASSSNDSQFTTARPIKTLTFEPQGPTHPVRFLR